MLGVADEKEVWLSINPAWTRTLGWRQDEIASCAPRIGWSTPTTLPRHDPRSAIWRRVARRSSSRNRFRSKERGYRPCHGRRFPENGLLYCVARDVTDERAQAAAIAEQTAAQERTWRFSPDLLSVIDLRSTLFDRVNPAWTAALAGGPTRS